MRFLTLIACAALWAHGALAGPSYGYGGSSSALSGQAMQFGQQAVMVRLKILVVVVRSCSQIASSMCSVAQGQQFGNLAASSKTQQPIMVQLIRRADSARSSVFGFCLLQDEILPVQVEQLVVNRRIQPVLTVEKQHTIRQPIYQPVLAQSKQQPIYNAAINEGGVNRFRCILAIRSFESPQPVSFDSSSFALPCVTVRQGCAHGGQHQDAASADHQCARAPPHPARGAAHS